MGKHNPITACPVCMEYFTDPKFAKICCATMYDHPEHTFASNKMEIDYQLHLIIVSRLSDLMLHQFKYMSYNDFSMFLQKINEYSSARHWEKEYLRDGDFEEHEKKVEKTLEWIMGLCKEVKC